LLVVEAEEGFEIGIRVDLVRTVLTTFLRHEDRSSDFGLTIRPVHTALSFGLGIPLTKLAAIWAIASELLQKTRGTETVIAAVFVLVFAISWLCRSLRLGSLEAGRRPQALPFTSSR
jgi:hypothetical protein